MPFKTEHSASLLDLNTEKMRVERTRGSGDVKVNGVVVPSNISVLWYIQDKDGVEVPVPQSLRFPVRNWSDDDAQKWLKDNKVKGEFEPADQSDGDDRPPCFQFYIDKVSKDLNIILHDEIGFWGTQSKDFLQLLNDNGKVKNINLDINSPGGEVFDGFSIYNSLKQHQANINVNISGVAASIASVIAMAGDKITMPMNTTMMIHKPMVSIFYSNADELRKNAEVLDKLENGIVNSYSRANRTSQELTDMLRDQTWMSAEEAVEMGFADEITDKVDIVNFHDLSSFKNVPDTVLNDFSAYHGDTFDMEMPKDKKTLKDFIVDIFNKEIFPDKPPSRSEKMSDTKEFEALQTQNSDLVIQNTDLKKKLEDATTVNQNLTATIESQAKDSRVAEYKTFVDELVTEGRIRPVDVDTHVENMELRYQEDVKNFSESAKKTDKLDAYKDMIKEFPKTVDTSGEHVASKTDAKEKEIGEDAIEKRAKELVVEAVKNDKKLSMKDALMMAHQETLQ